MGFHAQEPNTAGGGAVDSVNGETGVVVIDKSDVGLGNVDNTADTAKPVSTAQQSALDAKLAASAVSAFALTVLDDTTAAAARTTLDAAQIPGAWTAYTPTWTALGTAPSLGNGTLAGAYCQIGKLVFFRMRLVFGTTTTAGTSVWEFTVPVTARSDFATNYGFALSGGGEDAGVIGYTFSSGLMRGGTKFWIETPNNPNTSIGASSEVGATTPHAWGNTDNLTVFGFYEAA